jgi:hypothetical protein
MFDAGRPSGGYRCRVAGDLVTATFGRDQAFVLSHWLDEQLGTEDFDRLVDRDPAVWSAIHVLTGLLEDDPIVFSTDYGRQLEAARARLRERLGEEFVRGRTPATVNHRPAEGAADRPGRRRAAMDLVFTDGPVR